MNDFREIYFKTNYGNGVFFKIRTHIKKENISVAEDKFITITGKTKQWIYLKYNNFKFIDFAYYLSKENCNKIFGSDNEYISFLYQNKISTSDKPKDGRWILLFNYNILKMEKINYTYSYCTEEMIDDAMIENEISYPDVMEFVEYNTFSVNAKNLEEANNTFLKHQAKYTTKNKKMFDIEKDVKMDIEAEENEDKYIRHGLEQDWDTFYFKRDKNGLA
ncbi:MAG: hypothetical protein GY849_02580 [Deltaproteobacteria bacterium]|nr:hypothetical protein [Deltaproteobacteria bacterium]